MGGAEMAGYLDQYGAADARREKIIRRLVISVVTIAVAAGVLMFVFHNYRQERQVKKFFELLAAHDYKDAHAMFNPGPGYPMSSFLRDWAPEAGEVNNFRIVKSRSCGSGVILTVRYGKDREQVLWVQRDDLSLGFSPFPACPANGHPPVSVPPGVQ
jgi:hypothetical protein